MKYRYSFDVLMRISLVLVWSMILASCAQNPPAGLSDAPPIPPSGAQPAITALSPPDSGLGGINVITIAGSNFSPVLDQNLVYFDTARAVMIAATATELKVKAPRFYKDSVRVKVTTQTSSQFSNTVFYKLQNPVKEFGQVQSFEAPWGMATDRAGNVYVAMQINDIGAGVKRYDPFSVRVDFAPRGNEAKWNGMRFGPGGDLFAVSGISAVYRIPGSGGVPPRLWRNLGGGAQLADLDFDPQSNLWTGRANGGTLFRISPDSVAKSFPYAGSVRTIRYFNGYLYIGGRLTGETPNKITRVRVISADSIGPVETVYTLPSSGDSLVTSVYAINFSVDGDMCLGTDASNPITIVHPDGSSEPYLTTYLTPSQLVFAWGPGRYMYAVQGDAAGGSISRPRKIYRVDMQKNGAPYYGRP